MTFNAYQKAELAKPLARDHVKERTQAGRKLSYIEAWVAIAEANRIFGFDGWTRETVETRCVMERERGIGAQQRPGWGVSYVAKVRVTAVGLIREGTGAGHGIDADLGQAHESAIKEAESDAMKRALMTFGNPFGLALYDKTQANVEHEPPPAAKRPNGKAAAESYTRPAHPVAELRMEARENAKFGRAAFKAWYRGLDADAANELNAISDELAAIMKAADQVAVAGA